MTTSIDMTSRERVAAIQAALLDSEVTPEMARQYLMTLTGLLGSLTTELRVADMAYKHHLHQCYQAEASANRAKIAAEDSVHFDAMKVAKDTHELCIETIRSCKVFLRSLEEEMRLAR
jgi:hypothetical protein